MKAELLAVLGDDLMVVNAARVSMAKRHDTFDPETDQKLINYLAREGHFTPFAHPKAMFRVELPIFVARQWEKHRIRAVRGYDIYDQNKVSRRYVDDELTFFVPDQWRSRPVVLPQTMYTQWVETGSLAYWYRLCDLRMDAHAQREIHDLACQVFEQINDLACQVSAQMETAFPVSWAALWRNCSRV